MAPHPSGDPTRRTVLQWFLGTSLGALAVMILYPVARFLVPPAIAESEASTVTLSIDPSSIAPNSGQIFRFGSQPGMLLRTPAGELRAFSAVCTHLGCTVQYRSDLSQIWCPCHNGHYDLQGRVAQGPPPAPLPQFTVNARGSEIVVSRES